VSSTIPAALDLAASRYGDQIAIAEPAGPQVSFRELNDRANGIAAALAAAGIGAGDRVAVWSPNTHHWVLAALGALAAGATLVPVNTRFTGPEALDVIGRSGATALFVAGPFLGIDRLSALRAADQAEPGQLRSLRLITRIPVEDTTSAGDEISWPGAIVQDWVELERSAAGSPRTVAAARVAAIGPDDVSDILFTSGTTGRSKGAMSSHQQSLDVARAWADCGEVTSSDRYLVLNPFFHSFGYKAGILVCLLTGATIVPQLVYEAEQAMRLIESERITVLPGAPTIYQTILDDPAFGSYDLSSLRLAVTGAAVVPGALVERMQSELSFDTVLTAYGLTEAVVVTMCRPGDPARTVATTSGRATAGFEIRLGRAGPNAGGRSDADSTDVGEILLRGPNVMLGYLDDPAATKEAVDADGWLHTGDVGRLDADGNLTITDRLKDMYICGGFNVYPAEVEQALARLDGVAESVVIGVPDRRFGEIGKAFIVAKPGSQLTEMDVLAHCRSRLANFKVPRYVEFRTELPRNPAGKPLKRLLKEESR
jgi:HIP---CoA ligase